ncbi:MAG: hypothetical protein LBJ67_08540 [Planctomycetaceae bacterium]|nr:hypothetical protein [Planctomycetaceae bacterium]
MFIFYYFRYGFQIGLGDLRLTERYFILLKQAMQHSPLTAAGLSIPVDEQSAFAATVAVSRFFANAKTTPCALASPLRQFARQQLVGEEYALLIVDWSRLKYKNHMESAVKSDRFNFCRDVVFNSRYANTQKSKNNLSKSQASLVFLRASAGNRKFDVVNVKFGFNNRIIEANNRIIEANNRIIEANK